jgi:(p)ppGpp synthase/HD superfamily hydrolase
MIKERLLQQARQVLEGPLTLDKSILVAVLAHAGQEDKGQNAYIRHPLRVMEKLDCEDEMICAVCHDVVEDTFVTLEDLRELGYTQNQLKTIDSLTKRDGESYPSRIERIKNSYVARKIKEHDIRDNSQLWRLKNRVLTPKDLARMQQYIDALVALGKLEQRD